MFARLRINKYLVRVQVLVFEPLTFLVTAGHLCNKPFGMQTGRIKNKAITASSMWDRYHGPWLARLNARRMGRYMSAWASRYRNRYQWLQVDTGRLSRVIRVGTQGRKEVSQWVTAYKLGYSVDGVHFAMYRLNSRDKVSGSRKRWVLFPEKQRFEFSAL